MTDEQGQSDDSRPAVENGKKEGPRLRLETFTLSFRSDQVDLIKQRPAGTLAEAVDLLVERLRAQENRERLEGATPQPTTPEQEEGESIFLGIEFDREP